MTDQSDQTSNPLADRLRLWIIIAGYVLGSWAILRNVLMLLAWGLPFNRLFYPVFLIPIHQLATAACLASPLLLVAGCWGFQQHRRWARPVLLTYAGIWIASIFVIQSLQLIDMLSGAYGELTFRQILSSALGSMDLSVYASVFPVSMILCLTRPEIRDQFPEFRSGFAPILKEGSK